MQTKKEIEDLRKAQEENLKRVDKEYKQSLEALRNESAQKITEANKKIADKVSENQQQAEELLRLKSELAVLRQQIETPDVSGLKAELKAVSEKEILANAAPSLSQ